MKRARFYDISIEKPGDASESFDPFKYLESLTTQRDLNGIFFNDGTALLVSSSWNEARPLSVLAHCFRLVLRKYVRDAYRAVFGFLLAVERGKTRQRS